MDQYMDLGRNVTSTFTSEPCVIYQTRNDTGEGVMTSYTVFEGVYLMFNDFHMSRNVSELSVHGDMLCIDYCKEGAMEWDCSKDRVTYIEAGDLKIDNRKSHQNEFVFPTSHYHGISLVIHIEEASASLNHFAMGLTFDLKALKEKFINHNTNFISKSDLTIRHILSELEYVAEDIKIDYFKIKVFELLLYLKGLDVPSNLEERPYFYKNHVSKVKAIHEFMISRPENRYTLSQLSEMFNIPQTAMKSCFKGIYGTSIGQYMKGYRINQAAVDIQNTNMSIADIALKYGYSNPSKFSSTFKMIIGQLPQEYRLEKGIKPQYETEESGE